MGLPSGGAVTVTLSAPFVRRVLATAGAAGESRFDLRFFTTAVEADSRGDIITGTTSDPVKTIVGAEYAAERAGLSRFTKILFGADYFNGRPDPSTRSSQLMETNNQPREGGSR
jgi:hypothetical protein